MANKTLLYTINVDWYFQSHWLQRAEAAQQAGYRVIVLTHFSRPDLKRLFEAQGLECINLDVSRSGLNPIKELRTVVALYRAVRRIRPHLIQTITIKPNLYGGLIAKLLRIPMVSSISGLGIIFSSDSMTHQAIRFWVEKVYRFIYARPGCKVLFQNVDDCRRFVTDHVVQQEQTVVIPGSGVDLAQYAFAPEPNNRPPIVLFAARLLRDKGLHTLIKAAKQLSARGCHFTLQVAGILDPSVPTAIPEQQLIEWDNAGLIDWLGQRNDMPGLLARTNIVCLPTFYGEGIPRILIEAAACGRACVATDIPGCREIVRQGENGLLVPAHDPDALASALQTLIEAPALRRRMGEHGRNMAEQRFSLERVVDQTLAVYRKLLA
jgi:glycosyltransferase involved in cell wall biosynthesis